MSTCIVGGSPDQCVGRGIHGFELHRLWDGVVGTNPQHLLSSHQDSVGMFGRVKEDLDVTDATLLPLAEIAVPSVKLGAFLEQDFLILLPRLCLYLRVSLTRGLVHSCTQISTFPLFSEKTKILQPSILGYLWEWHYWLKVDVHIMRRLLFITALLIVVVFCSWSDCGSKNGCSSICPCKVGVFKKGRTLRHSVCNEL